MNPDNPVSAVFWEETEVAARNIGVQLDRLEARNPEGIARAFETAAAQSAGALIVFDDPVIWSYRAMVVALAQKHRLPAMYGYRDFVDGGGLMSYGPDRPDQYRRTALFVDKILKGAKPADLPVEQPTKFQLVINLKAAKALGLSVPPTLLAQADEVIE
jgi:putative ABC transport system substrate-binding protein